jgi:hypothetical protein
MANKVEVEQIFHPVLRFSPASTTPPLRHTYFHLNTARRVGQASKAWEPANKGAIFRKSGTLDRRVSSGRFMHQRTTHRIMPALLHSLIRKQNSDILLPILILRVSALLLTTQLPMQSVPRVPPTSGSSGRGLKLTTHFHRVSRIRMSAAMHSLPIYAFTTYTANFNVTFLGAFAKLRNASVRPSVRKK